MNIGIIGSGNVAQTLGKGLLEAGHHVTLGTREPDRKELAAWRNKHSHHHGKAMVSTTTAAANFGEVIILAVAWHAAEDVLEQIRPELAGKVVIDVTNPLVFSDNEAPALSVGFNMSGGEIVQQSLPDSHVVKTLNIISYANMVQPRYVGGEPIMFYCGNNDSACQQVADLLMDLGWKDTVHLGRIEKSRVLEPLCLLWLEYGVARDTWNHALAVLER